MQLYSRYYIYNCIFTVLLLLIRTIKLGVVHLVYNQGNNQSITNKHTMGRLSLGLADTLVWKWEKWYGSVIDRVRAYMAFAIIRAINVCLRGSRLKW